MITFGTLITSFFSSYLANQKGCSRETITSYSDCIRLLIKYSCEHLELTIDKLAINMITEELILDFLDYLEQERNNTPKTRNQRLAAIKTFFRFTAGQEPNLIEVCERVCNISKKKTAHKLIESLENDEVKAIMNQPNTNKLNGLRDKALLTLLYNTGARVQEVVDLNISNLNLENPKQVVLTGKGNKERIIPLYQETVDAINAYLNLRKKTGLQSNVLFLNADGKRITRFGIGYLVKEYVAKAAKKCPSLANKRVSTHTFRHTIALHLIQSGVDITVVKEWLGHASIKTTSLYVEINIQMKRKALEACPPPTTSSQTEEKPPEWHNAPVLVFLQQLSRKAALC